MKECLISTVIDKLDLSELSDLPNIHTFNIKNHCTYTYDTM